MSGKPYKQVVNEVLSRGLSEVERPTPRSYRLQPASLGQPRGGANLDKVLHIADDLEDEALSSKLEQRK